MDAVNSKDTHPHWTDRLELYWDDYAADWERHKREPHVSFDAYRHRCFLSHGADVHKQRRIYLDLRFWIYCRDAHLGVPQRPIHDRIWRRLQTLTDSGRVVCPISYPIVSEILKQGDVDRRMATTRVVDTLSRNVAIRPSDELFHNELCHFLLSSMPGKSTHPLDQLAWTFPTWWLGEATPQLDAFDEATNTLCRKAFFDAIKKLPLSIVMEALSDSTWPAHPDTAEYYSDLNRLCLARRDEISDYHSAFMIELAGLLDDLTPQITRASRAMYAAEYGAEPPADDVAGVDENHPIARLIYHAYDHRKISNEIPFLQINAGIHAAVRHRRQRYKMGDLWDHMHAHPAIAYCHAFFTEKSLGHLVSNKPLELDKEYDCSVLWREQDILDYVMAIDP